MSMKKLALFANGFLISYALKRVYDFEVMPYDYFKEGFEKVITDISFSLLNAPKFKKDLSEPCI